MDLGLFWFVVGSDVKGNLLRIAEKNGAIHIQVYVKKPDCPVIYTGMNGQSGYGGTVLDSSRLLLWKKSRPKVGISSLTFSTCFAVTIKTKYGLLSPLTSTEAVNFFTICICLNKRVVKIDSYCRIRCNNYFDSIS